MTANPSSGRFQRLEKLLAQDPANPLLLADTCEAAVAQGEFDAADRLIDQGIQHEGETLAWRFRRASLRMAQRRLPEARQLLEALRSEGPPHPAVDHNLAYVALLEGRHADCLDLLAPWVGDPSRLGPDAAALETLWLRALHHLDRLKDAWSWVERRGAAHLPPAAAGVASLIALDLSRIDDAEQLSHAALRADAQQPEALVAAGAVAMARRDLRRAREWTARAVGAHPHQSRAWSTLGFVDLLEGNVAAARGHFLRALAIEPRDTGTLIALGWACIAEGDLEAARSAFEAAVAADAEYAEGHGGLAVVLALQGAREPAAAHGDRARKLQPGNIAARYASAVLSGQSDGLRGVQKLVQQILG